MMLLEEMTEEERTSWFEREIYIMPPEKIPKNAKYCRLSEWKRPCICGCEEDTHKKQFITPDGDLYLQCEECGQAKHPRGKWYCDNKKIK